MNIQQLRFVCELARQSLNISKVAEVLHTSQPNISTQIRLLEEELNLAIFQRQRRRLVAVTPDGLRIIERAQRVLAELNEIRAIGNDYLRDESGTLTIAASHTQARFRLPAVLRRFRERYPDVHINIRPENGRAIRDALIAGAADIGILSKEQKSDTELVYIPFQSYRRLLLVCPGHPLLRKKKVSFKDIIQHAMVLYEPSQTAEAIMQKLGQVPLSGPSILRAANADIVKAYVEYGLGITILPDITFDPVKDTGLRAIPVDHIFPPSTTYIALNRKHHLRQYAYSFIESLGPRVTRGVIEKAMAQRRPAPQ